MEQMKDTRILTISNTLKDLQNDLLIEEKCQRIQMRSLFKNVTANSRQLQKYT